MNGPTFKGKDSRFCACVSPVTSLSFFNQLVASRLPRQIFVRSGQLCSVLSTSSLLLVRFHRFGKGMSPEDTATESFKCNGVCSRKDGSKAKGCPCKKRGFFCTERCKFLATGKKLPESGKIFFFLFYLLLTSVSSVVFRIIPLKWMTILMYSRRFHWIVPKNQKENL